jgi:predicted metal-dependent TIM-barrel fold hydrolase
MDEQRMAALVRRYGSTRIIVNSAADWGISDPLKVPKTVAVMREQGIPEDAIETIVWRNPVTFFAQSGRLDLDAAAPAPSLWEGNSVKRG